ncbi:MAG: VOC family protein [Pseudomonadota bacterium]
MTMRVLSGFLAAGLMVVSAPASVANAQQSAERQEALGIGGLFVRAADPAALSAWYEKHLGINPVPTSYDDTPWVQQEGPTIFSPMPDIAEGMLPEGKSWMLNLRVADIEAFVAQLKADGVAVEIDPQTYPNGRFATLADPEGNPIQLWEPKLP